MLLSKLKTEPSEKAPFIFEVSVIRPHDYPWWPCPFSFLKCFSFL